MCIGVNPFHNAPVPRLPSLFVVVLTISCRPDPLQPAEVTGYDDEFTGDALDASWKLVNESTCKISVADGQLHMQPTKNVVWYKADQGPLAYKLVSGNFKASAAVRARKASDPKQATNNGFQFGGIIARDPASDGASAKESYVFNVVGYRGDYLSVETKTTKKDHSDVEAPSWASGDAELRICRLNSEFFLYKREIGATKWDLAIQYDRPDLPKQLQVGPIAYSFTDEFDLRASFEWIRFAPVSTKEDCLTD